MSRLRFLICAWIFENVPSERVACWALRNSVKRKREAACHGFGA